MADKNTLNKVWGIIIAIALIISALFFGLKPEPPIDDINKTNIDLLPKTISYGANWEQTCIDGRCTKTYYTKKNHCL